MNRNLAEALSLLGVSEVLVRSASGKTKSITSPKEHAKALFTYLNMAGYLSEPLIAKAVKFLSIAKPFKQEEDIVAADLISVCNSANQNGKFDANLFITHFAKQEYFVVDDLVDLITFLQQTAFDRLYGVERDRLQVRSWMEENNSEFKDIAEKLGVTAPLPPLYDQYPAVGIMGASSVRVKTRLQYFRDLDVACDFVWALSGNRELSKGLDEEAVMERVAKTLDKPVKFISKKSGVDTREFLDGITETMMVNCLIHEICPNKRIGIIDSAFESGHWRATSAQNAADIAPVFIEKILQGVIVPVEDQRYRFLIIAEQPYAGRMTRQVQREFNKEISKRGLEGKLHVVVEGCGSGMLDEELQSSQALTRVNSELGALMAERFNDARLLLKTRSDLVLRDPNIVMFSKRDETYKTYQEKAELGLSSARP